MAKEHYEDLPTVTCEDLVGMHKGKDAKEHVIVDVRDTLEFDAGHIKDSINVPRKELQTNLESLVPDKDRRVIVIVGPTQEPELKAIHDTLAAVGYANVKFLAGGFDQFCEIAPLELEPDLIELTPEESGFVGHGEGEEPLDPHTEEDESIS